MKDILISIIVPVYKVEQYLNRCVESLVNQTYNNIEIILVDDGSPDNSPQMCDEWSLKDSRIKVVHKANGGLSSARNAGINTANGNYILFCDSDDFYDIETCEHLNNKIKTDDVDLVIFSLNYVNDKYINSTTINLEEKKYDEKFIKNELIPNYINLTAKDKHYIQPYSVNKLYKTSIIKKFNVYFDENRRAWEDKPFVVTFLKYCKNMLFVNKPFYNYVSVENSLSRSFNPNILNYIFENFKLYHYLFSSVFDFNSIYINNYYLKVTFDSLVKLYDCDKKETSRKINDIIDNVTFNKWMSNSSSYNIIKFLFERNLNKKIKFYIMIAYLNLKKINIKLIEIRNLFLKILSFIKRKLVH